MKVIDAHHHIWRLGDLAWLNGPTQPRIFGDYDAIRRDYLIEEFIDDVVSEGVIGSVYIQVNWPPGKEIDEVRWVQDASIQTQDKQGIIQAIIGYVDFSSDNCAEVLKELSQFPLMRGIRQQLHWHQNPLYKFADVPNLMMDAKWRRNFSLLQQYDWLFELQVFASQMKDAARFAADFPETPMVLQHCGMPENPSPQGMDYWRDSMKFLAEQPNVHCKFSGLGTFIHENSTSFVTDVTGYCLDLFGADRCIYGSNFPIEKIWTKYSDLIQSYRDSLKDLSQESQNAIFHDNAVQLYKL